MATDRRFFVDVFEDIVNAMRATGTITASSEVSGVYTLTSDNVFNSMESVKINDVDYLITSATSTKFVINAVTGQDFTSDTWQALAPYSDYGHYREVANRLNLKSTGEVDKFRLWPLIVLIFDIEEDYDNDFNYNYSLSPANFIIVTPTSDKTDTTPLRMENVFRPTLYPLYWDFIEKIKESKAISTPNNLLSHKKYDRPGYGNETKYGNDGLIFNEHLDAIQLTVPDLKVYKNTVKHVCSSL